MTCFNSVFKVVEVAVESSNKVHVCSIAMVLEKRKCFKNAAIKIRYHNYSTPGKRLYKAVTVVPDSGHN